MTTIDACVELEIDLDRVPAGGHQVELRFTDPAAEAEVPPERGTAVLDLPRSWPFSSTPTPTAAPLPTASSTTPTSASFTAGPGP